MSLSQIKQFVHDAAESAMNYYDSADTNKHSRINIPIIKIKKIENDLYDLFASQKIKNPDNIVLCINTHIIDDQYYEDHNNRYISRNFYKIIKYDATSIMVELKGGLIDIFPNISAKDITLVSDLKFLIQRVRNWYLDFGHLIQSPPLPIISKAQIFSRQCESDAQAMAVESALSNSISYIWGAPGTGKTQMVLANCVMSYIKQNKQIMILAPTNNAIEQTLQAIIAVLEEDGQSIDVLYRLGTASNDFALKHGSICERIDIQTKIEETKSAIKSLRQQKKQTDYILKLRNDYDYFKSCLNDLEKTASECKSLLNEKDLLFAQISTTKSKISSANDILSKIDRQRAELEKKKRSFPFKLKSIFNKQNTTHIDYQLSQLTERTTIYKNNLSQLAVELDILEHSLHKAKRAIEACEENKNSLISCIEALSVTYFNTFKDLDDTAVEFSNIVNKYATYEIDTTLCEKIDAQEDQLQQLVSSATQNIKGKLVFALTVDYLYNHYKTLSEVGVSSAGLSHVFLDEAAYCSLIKAGILFSLNTPVTLLGDHMQLPPICEASERAINNINTKLFLWSMSSIHFPLIFQDSFTLDALLDVHINQSSFLPANMAISALPQTFRFGDNLASILDDFVYKNGFHGRNDIDTKITIINAVKSSTDKEPRENASEALAIKNFIIQNKLKNYAVMTPYKAQRKILNTILRGITDPDNILTIHASQGREWDTIIISIVDRSNAWFTDSNKPDGLRTMNTAISRAKQTVIIACDQEYWIKKSDNQLIGKLIAASETNIASNASGSDVLPQIPEPAATK